MIALILKLISNPFFEKILFPQLVEWISNICKRKALKLEIESAKKAAKDAKTIDELRDAARRLSDTTDSK